MKVFVVAVILAVCSLFVWVKINLVYDEGEGFRAVLKILFFKYQLYPEREKKPRLKDYSPAAMRRRKIKEEKKRIKQLKKQRVQETEKAEIPKKKRLFEDAGDLINFLQQVVVKLLNKFFRYSRLDVKSLHIKVGASEAAQTAVAYGAAAQSLSYLLEFIGGRTKLVYKSGDAVTVEADFTGGQFDARIDMTLRLMIWHIAVLLVMTGYTLLINLYGGKKDGRQQYK